MADKEQYEADRCEGDVREGDGDEGNGRDELPPFTPEQLQWINRIVAARQMQRSSLIAGLDCGLDRWTGLLDWILKKDVRLACKTACVAKTFASQGHTDVAEPRKRGAKFTINFNKATNYAAKLMKPTA